MSRELYTIVNGEICEPQKLGLRQGAFLDMLDINGTQPLFSNPFGQYSANSLDKIISETKNFRSTRSNLTLENSIDIIRQIQDKLNLASEEGLKNPLIRDYISFKGYDIAEVREQISGLNSFVESLEKDKDATLGSMLNFEGKSEDFFSSNKILERFGILSSGNLGLFETVSLLYSGILAQSAKNGGNLSIIVKPTSQDFLFYDLMLQMPEDARKGFSRVTWGSDIPWDAPLMKKLINSLDGAIYFGRRSTLENFRAQLSDDTNHQFYYDHFPLIILGENASREQIREAAKKAVSLCYKNKGEACLSLQDVFVHEAVYDSFISNLRREIKGVNYGVTGTQLPRFGKEQLEEVSKLKEALSNSGAIVEGRIGYQPNRMDIILAHNIDVNNPILETENAFPFLAVATYSSDSELSNALLRHLKPSDPKRSSDKHIYAILIGTEGKSRIADYATKNSHRVELVGADDTKKLRNFPPYKSGIPHCGGISFLADIFGKIHLDSCYK